jgi:hypothetical protein
MLHAAGRLCVRLILPLLMVSSCGQEYDRTLTAQDIPRTRPVTIRPGSHTIVLQPEPSPSEIHAAEELKTYLASVLGDEPVVRIGGSATPQTGMIVLGCGPLARQLGVDPDPAMLGEQGSLLRTVPPHIVIAGTRGAGTLYGVERFIEEYLGVRWYAPGVTRVPSSREIVIPPVERLVRPAFLWRHTSYEWPGKDDAFLVRMADNSGTGDETSPNGIGYSFDGTCHSYFRFISPEEFFDTHPEYFSEIGGVRIAEETQLCLTNPDVLEIVTERMLERMQRYPHARQHNFSQMDYYNYCQCPRCREINERYGTPGGTQFWFVNRLAERTSKVYPDKLISTLAYMYTAEPPKGLTMHPNVAVWLCHMYPSCDSHPIATCPLNADYKQKAVAWSKITSHLYAWHYITNFTHYYMPFPNLRAMSADLRFYRDIGVEGVYLQGMGHTGGGGEFSLLRPYYGMKLLWDPDTDPDTLIEDFLQGYYGPAGPAIGEYIEMLHKKVGDEDIHMHLYTNPAQGYLTDSVMQRAAELFDEAEAAVADDPELRERVLVARMPLTYARIFPRNGYLVEGGRVVWQSEIATLAEVVEFLERMERHGFRTIREVAGEPELLLLLYLIIKAEPEILTIGNDYLTVEVVPLLGGRALRVKDRSKDTSVTAFNIKESLFFPFSGGLEDRVGEGFSFFGWIEPALAVRPNRSSLTTLQTTVDGYQVKRTLTLLPHRPVLRVESTLVNPGPAARTARLRSHLELDLGTLRGTRITFTDRAGEAVDQDIRAVIDALREGIHYYGLSAPSGSWRFSGTKGLDLVQRFENDQIDFTWLYAYPETLGELEVELWAHRKTLGPGERSSIQYEIEIGPTKATSHTGRGS